MNQPLLTPSNNLGRNEFTQNSTVKKVSAMHSQVISEMEEPNTDIGIIWQNPLPLKSALLPVLPVSESMLPKSLRTWLLDISERMKCPLDYVASATVVMISALIGTRLAIKPKSRDDWTIIPNLWGAVIGDPSVMKTPSVNEVFKFLNRLIAESNQQFEDEMHRYQAELITYEAQKKVYQDQEKARLKGKPVNSPVSYPEAPKKPTERRYITNDATVEKIGELLNENPTGLLQYRDELIGLLAGWDKQGREQDRAFYLESWNGNGSITIDRIGRGTTHVKQVCLSLFGGIQPSKLFGYLKAANQFDNDGFVQRLQLAVYPDKPTWGYVDEYPDRVARDTAFAIIRKIADSGFSTFGFAPDEYNRYAYTHFDTEGQEVFKQWLIDWETNVLPNESGLLLEHFTKYRSLMPSLALIFHVVNCIDAPQPEKLTQKHFVTAEAARMAVEWCEYLKSHARRIYGLLDNQQVEAAKTLLQHLKAGHLADGFKTRDIQQKGWSGLVDLDTIESALAELTNRHWLWEAQPQQSTAGRPQSPHYLINPKIITQNV